MILKVQLRSSNFFELLLVDLFRRISGVSSHCDVEERWRVDESEMDKLAMSFTASDAEAKNGSKSCCFDL